MNFLSGSRLHSAETSPTSVAHIGTLTEQNGAFLKQGNNQTEPPSELNLPITTKSTIAKGSQSNADFSHELTTLLFSTYLAMEGTAQVVVWKTEGDYQNLRHILSLSP